jgi:hypothetical protein
MDKGTGLGRIGKTYRSGAWANVDGQLDEPQARELGAQVAGAVVLVLVVLGVIGWAFTL